MSGNAGTAVHILVHIRDQNAPPADPGYIVAYHRLTRHVARFRQLGRPFDGHGHAFMGDVVDGQVPITVQVPDALYNQLPVVQVPTGPRLEQLLLADPDAALVGPFNAGDPDVTPVTTRALVVVPNEYVRPFLGVGMRPRDAYTTLHGIISQGGQEIACEPLLDWLRVALTRRAQDALPRTVVPPLLVPMYAPPDVHQVFLAYRRDIAHRDLPLLSTSAQAQGAQVIANSLSTLVHEQRLAREEAADQRRAKEARKTPGEYYGVLLERLMRWAHVSDEADLPSIHEAVANAKKSKVRALLQKTVEDCLLTNDLVEDFPLSTALATKVTELSWHSAIPDDFSCGINLFAVGSLDNEAVEFQRQQNRQADLLTANEGTASLEDLVEVCTPKGDVAIPRSLAQLRYLVQRTYALWSVLLGAHHPLAVRYRAFQHQLTRREKFLESVEPSDPTQRYLVPALIGRWLQLRTNLWLQDQAKSAAPIPPPDLNTLFDQMMLLERWEPRFPSRYLVATAPPNPPSTTGGEIAQSNPTPPLVPGGAAPGNNPRMTTTATSSTALTTKKSTTLRSTTYNEAFQKFKAMGIKTAALRDHLREQKVPMPKNKGGQEVCLAWHVIGMCNTACKRSATHTPKSEEEDQALLDWCEKHYTLSA